MITGKRIGLLLLISLLSFATGPFIIPAQGSNGKEVNTKEQLLSGLTGDKMTEENASKDKAKRTPIMSDEATRNGPPSAPKGLRIEVKGSRPPKTQQ